MVGISFKMSEMNGVCFQACSTRSGSLLAVAMVDLCAVSTVNLQRLSGCCNIIRKMFVAICRLRGPSYVKDNG